jgi:hypothetical protein
MTYAESTSRHGSFQWPPLNPYEEAKSVRAMLDRGLTEDGAAQALGWPKHRVTARVKILELPERAQQLIGEGTIHPAAIDQLRALGTVAPNLLNAVIAYLDDGNAWAAERLTREPGSVLDAALTHSGNGKVFAAYLSRTRGSRDEHLTKEQKPRGAIWSQRNLYRDVIEPARESAGIDFTPDDPRHTFVSTLMAAGIPRAEVAAHSDHSVGDSLRSPLAIRGSSQATLAVYTHVSGLAR